VSTTWDEASKCPEDESTGKVVSRKQQGRAGQLVTLECQLTRCQYHDMGWVILVRPDGTIPDKVEPSQREKTDFDAVLYRQRRARYIEALERQASEETKPGAEVAR
jgi:hypothetical protein